MGIWIERFVIVLLAAIAGATILTNPWKLDRIQQVSLIVACAAVALFLGRTFERIRTTTVVEPVRNSDVPGSVWGRSAIEGLSGRCTASICNSRRW